MKRLSLAVAVLLCTSSIAFAQQDPADDPASKEDVQKYLEVMHSREMMAKMVDAMAKPMRQMMHEQFGKEKDKLPADFEARMDNVFDDYLKTFPWEEVLQSMVPVYQKHFTKGDIDHLIAFYSTPTGQKVLRELPAVTAEAMQAMMPLLRERLDVMTRNVQQHVAQMIKESEANPGKNPPASNN